mgnify:CR=1 FL=1
MFAKQPISSSLGDGLEKAVLWHGQRDLQTWIRWINNFEDDEDMSSIKIAPRQEMARNNESELPLVLEEEYGYVSIKKIVNINGSLQFFLTYLNSN